MTIVRRLLPPLEPLPSWLGFARLLCAILALGSVSLHAAPPEQDDDAIPVRRPGLIATYHHPVSGMQFSRYEAIPACQLEKSESPDPRLPAGGWQVRWNGVVEILHPGKYQFSTEATGKVELSLDGAPVALPTPIDNQPATSGAVELRLGLHNIEVKYAPAANEPARCHLFWQTDAFEREPIPSQALGHAVDAPAVDDIFFRGRALVEDHNCVACHQPSDRAPLARQLAPRPAPRLTAAGRRLKPGWIYHWLADPAAHRPEAVMPRMFDASERGDTERYAVSMFLAAQGGPVSNVPNPPDEVIRQSTTEGEQLFHKIGCAVCHQRQGDRPARVTLRGLSQKTTTEAIETFLQKPSAVAPAGRMPEFVLGKLDKHQLAIYLTYHDAAQAPAHELPAAPADAAIADAYSALVESDENRASFARLPAAERIVALGREVVAARNCAACHELKPAGENQPLKPRSAQAEFFAIAGKASGGCLGDVEAKATSGATRVPRFGASLDRAATAEFLRAAATAPAPRAPADAARAALARWNCTACHERDGLGGLTAEYVNRLGSGDNAAAELVVPPTLTQITAKLSAGALVGVLEKDDRSRPWMSLQMPRFGRERMQDLPRELAALDAGQLAAAAPVAAGTTPADETLAEAGRTLVGSRGFGCTKCHDMLGVPSSGTRGPDLAAVTSRVNRPWFERWMKDPQRIQQGTRMPTVFLNGESPYKDVLGGDPAGQRAAIWHYLAVARSLPPPEGLEPDKLERLAAGKRPVAVRTFLPGTTPRGIAVRFPNQVHTAFDAQTCRLAYAWHGEFLDMAPVWNGRGGKQAHILGATFWTAPEGCPWEMTAVGAAPPSFAGRGEDPTFGALVRDSKLHPSRLTFQGYHVDEHGPTFRYRLAGDGDAAAEIVEHLTALSDDVGVGLLRDLSIAAPADRTVWVHIADIDAQPQWAAGESSSAVQAGEERSAADCSLRVEQGGQPVLLRLRGAASPAAWVIARVGDRWQVLLRIPATAGAESRTVSLAVRRPSGDQADAWSRLVAEELK